MRTCQPELPVDEHNRSKVLTSGAMLGEGSADGRVRDPQNVRGSAGGRKPRRAPSGESHTHRFENLACDRRVSLVGRDPQRPSVWGPVSHVTIAEVAPEQIAVDRRIGYGPFDCAKGCYYGARRSPSMPPALDRPARVARYRSDLVVAQPGLCEPLNPVELVLYPPHVRTYVRHPVGRKTRGAGYHRGPPRGVR